MVPGPVGSASLPEPWEFRSKTPSIHLAFSWYCGMLIVLMFGSAIVVANRSSTTQRENAQSTCRLRERRRCWKRSKIRIRMCEVRTVPTTVTVFSNGTSRDGRQQITHARGRNKIMHIKQLRTTPRDLKLRAIIFLESSNNIEELVHFALPNFERKVQL